ncbi:unnamed protein product [Amoebophrya sp. A120]|nr:unnamed protein product [Amoebophrya sp. A120]|eukprot:GSA120T00023752001.1
MVKMQEVVGLLGGSTAADLAPFDIMLQMGGSGSDSSQASAFLSLGGASTSAHATTGGVRAGTTAGAAGAASSLAEMKTTAKEEASLAAARESTTSNEAPASVVLAEETETGGEVAIGTKISNVFSSILNPPSLVDFGPQAFGRVEVHEDPHTPALTLEVPGNLEKHRVEQTIILEDKPKAEVNNFFPDFNSEKVPPKRVVTLFPGTHVPEPSGAYMAAMLVVFAVSVYAFVSICHMGATDETVKRPLHWCIAAWLLLTHALTSCFLSFPAVFIVLLFFGCLAIVFFFGFSFWGEQIARKVPASLIVGYQVFRVFLEYLLHVGHNQGVVPQQMTVHGHNFDIITGILAFAVSLNMGPTSSSSSDDEKSPRKEEENPQTDVDDVVSTTASSCHNPNQNSFFFYSDRGTTTSSSTKNGEADHDVIASISSLVSTAGTTILSALGLGSAGGKNKASTTRPLTSFFFGDEDVTGSPERNSAPLISPASTIAPQLHIKQKVVLFVFNVIGLLLLFSVIFTILFSLPTPYILRIFVGEDSQIVTPRICLLCREFEFEFQVPRLVEYYCAQRQLL